MTRLPHQAPRVGRTRRDPRARRVLEQRRICRSEYSSDDGRKRRRINRGKRCRERTFERLGLHGLCLSHGRRIRRCRRKRTAAGSMPTPPPVPTGNISLQGAGATFPAPLYDAWFQAFTDANSNIKIDYQANGSGAGITAITQQTVDFGASDAPMKDAEVAAIKSGLKVLHIPTALGAVVVIFNVPGVDKLQLDSANVAEIFLGTITKWNDPAIAATTPASRSRTRPSPSSIGRTARERRTRSRPTSIR